MDPHKQIESAAALILSWAANLAAQAEGLEAELDALREQLEACLWVNTQSGFEIAALQGELVDAELAAAAKGRP